MNRHRRGPAKELPTSLFRAPRNRLTPTLFRGHLELTAVSAIVFFLGLLFGFQRPSRLFPPRLPATLHPIQPGGCILYFEPAFLSSGRCRSVPPFRPGLDSTSRHRALFLPFEGARNLLRFRLPCQPPSSTLFFPPGPLRRLRDFFVSGEAASTTAASGVNSAR